MKRAGLWQFVCGCVLLIGLSNVASCAATNFFESFEHGIANWIVGDADPVGVPAYWGIVASGFGEQTAHGGDGLVYCAATGYSGSEASPFYRDSMTAYLSRTVNLAGFTNASLSFWYRMPGVESGFDVARVYMGTTEIWSTDLAQADWQVVNLGLEGFLGATQTLTFQFTSDASVTNRGWYLDDIALTDAAAPQPPPQNDYFSAALLLSGASGSVSTSNRGATAEPGDPNPGSSIWYRWSPYTNGLVTFRTGGSAFDTVMCVYAGSTLESLVSLGCDDNGDTNNGSLFSFNAVVGTTFHLSVRGVGDAAGFLLLSWIQPEGTAPSLLPDLTVFADQSGGYLYRWYLDQFEPTKLGRTLMRVSTATPNIGPGALELRGSSTEPGVFQRIYRADGSFSDRFAGSFMFHAGHGHLHFDNWINLRLRSVLAGDGVGEVVASGNKTSFSIIDLFPYDTRLPGAPAIGLYEGGLIQGLSAGWMDVYGADLLDQWVDVTDLPSGRYWLEAIVDPANSIVEANETNNTTRILIDYTRLPSLRDEPPPNDLFSQAIPIAGLTGGDVGYNYNATAEAGEPAHYFYAAANSAWWRWVAGSNMMAVVSTDGSDFNTVLAVYTGTDVGSLTQIRHDDDEGVGFSSQVSFPATAGTTYWIAVDGILGSIGNVQLNVNPALNDSFAGPLAIGGMTGTASGSTRGATREEGEPLHAGISGSGSIWFRWTAPTNGPFTFQTRGSSFETLIGIYTGTAVDGLALIASGHTAGSNGASRVSFDAVAGTVYRIAVEGIPGASGVVKLAWSGPLPPAIVGQPLSTNAPAGSSVSFSVVTEGSGPLSYQWRHQGTNVIDGLYVEGSTSSELTLNKVRAMHAGGYAVVITNVYGAVTSTPGNLIVLDNPRVVYLEDLVVHSSKLLSWPVAIQSIGNEHAVQFTLLYDPSVLSNPRVMNVPVGAFIEEDRSQVVSGALGVKVTLPGMQTFSVGQHRVMEVVFAGIEAPTTMSTFAGFGLSPTGRAVTDLNGLAVPALFTAGTVTMVPLHLSFGEAVNGEYRLSLSALAGNTYVVDVSEDLLQWTPVWTNIAVTEILNYRDSTDRAHRFYRVRSAR